MNDVQNPVTENEMSTFMGRLSSTLVGYSRQAVEIEELKVALKELSDRVTSLVAEASNLRQEIYRTVGERDQARREAAENLEMAQTYEKERNEARLQVADLANRLDGVTHNREELAIALGDTRKELAQAKDLVEVQGRDLDYWKNRALSAEEARDKAQSEAGHHLSALERLRNAFNSVFANQQAA